MKRGQNQRSQSAKPRGKSTDKRSKSTEQRGKSTDKHSKSTDKRSKSTDQRPKSTERQKPTGERRYTTAERPKHRQPKPEAKQTHTADQIRLNKAISETGHCSRREADALIAGGHVTVNQKPAQMGQYIGPQDKIAVDGKMLKRAVKYIYLALHKPEGIECTTDTRVPDNIVDFMRYPQRIYPIGRLDKASEGLLLMTNHGDIVNKILRAGNAHEKEYVVTVNQPISPQFLDRMRRGVPILDTVTKPCKVTQEGERIFRIVLTQGLNRQIRRMCEALGYEVKRLVRVRIMHIHLGDLPKGKWRHLTAKEAEKLLGAIQHSTNDQEASTS